MSKLAGCSKIVDVCREHDGGLKMTMSKRYRNTRDGERCG